MAPHKALYNTASHRAFLGRFIRQLVKQEGAPITVQESHLIDDGIEAVMKLPREQRSLSALRTMLGMSDSGGVGARLVKWTSAGNLGWVFANRSEERRVGKECVSTGRSRGAPARSKKNTISNQVRMK